VLNGKVEMKISVIVPALNEEEHLPAVLARLQAMPQVCEVLVCDGGSADLHALKWRARCAQCVECSPIVEHR
jgi:acyl-CoA hydrolase